MLPFSKNKRSLPLHIINKLLSDESGHMAILTGLMLPVLLLAVGGVVDFGRAQIIRSHTHGAMDAAGLAIAAAPDTLSKEQRIALGQAFYEANTGVARLKKDMVAFDELNVNLQGTNSVSLHHNKKVESYLTKVVGSVPAINIGSLTEISLPRQINLALDGDIIFVLDTSGSMSGRGHTGGMRKIEVVQEAIREFSDYIYPPGTPISAADNHVRVGMTMYATKLEYRYPLTRVTDTITASGRPEFYHEVLNIRPRGLTCASCGLKAAFEMFQGTTQPASGTTDNPEGGDETGDSRRKYVIFLSDGIFEMPQKNPVRSAVLQCDLLKAIGAHIITIGYGNLGNPHRLEAMEECASEDAAGNREFYRNIYAGNLPLLFKRIAQNIHKLRITR